MGPGLRHRGRREVYESCSAHGNPRLANSPETHPPSSGPLRQPRSLRLQVHHAGVGKAFRRRSPILKFASPILMGEAGRRPGEGPISAAQAQ